MLLIEHTRWLLKTASTQRASASSRMRWLFSRKRVTRDYPSQVNSWRRVAACFSEPKSCLISVPERSAYALKVLREISFFALSGRGFGLLVSPRTFSGVPPSLETSSRFFSSYFFLRGVQPSVAFSTAPRELGVAQSSGNPSSGTSGPVQSSSRVNPSRPTVASPEFLRVCIQVP